MKDIQQLLIIKKMACDLNYQIIIHECPTIREKNGLALSSRNQYLSEIEKDEASILYKALIEGEKLIKENIDLRTIKDIMSQMIKKIKNIKIDYLSIADLKSFEELVLNKKNGLIKKHNKEDVFNIIFINKRSIKYIYE